jgi:hypothetical protein
MNKTTAKLLKKRIEITSKSFGRPQKDGVYYIPNLDQLFVVEFDCPNYKYNFGRYEATSEGNPNKLGMIFIGDFSKEEDEEVDCRESEYSDWTLA